MASAGGEERAPARPEQQASNSLREDLRQCSLDSLVDSVTAPSMPESFLIPPLVLTHSICTTSVDLFTSLVRRFLTPLGAGAAADEKAEFVIRTRVLVVLRTWVQQAPHDFRLQPALAQRLQQFLEKIVAAESQANAASALLKAARSIQDLYAKRMNEDDALRKARKIPPQPALPAGTTVELISFPAAAIAEALTTLDQARFNAIEPHELLNVAWTGSEKERKAPGVLAMIRWFNDVSAWALSEVVRHDQLRERVEVLKRLIGVAHALRELHSFSMMVAVMSGLRAFPSVRLHATWTEIAKQKKAAQRFIELQELCSPHHAYRALRAAMDSALVTQVIPHLGVFLSSFVLLNEMPSTVPGPASPPPLLNFAKCYATYALIERVRAFQERGPTGIEAKPELLSYLSHYEAISYADSLPLSQAIEPPPADGSNPPFPLLHAASGGQVSMAMEMGETVMKRFGVIKRRLQETQKQVMPLRASVTTVSHEASVYISKPPRMLLDPGESPVRWLSAKDKIAVCGGPADAVLRVMHIPTGECLSLIENCASPVMRYASGVFFHSTAAHLLVAVNLRDGETLTLAGHSDLITDVAVLPDARTLATASNDRTLVIWTLDMAPAPPTSGPFAGGSRVRTNSRVGKKVTCAGHKGAVTCVVIYPRSSHGAMLVLSGGADGSVRVWTKEGICLSTLLGHDSPLLSITLYGGSALSVSRDGGLRQWDIEAGRLTRQFALGAQPLPGTSVFFAHDHAVFAASSGALSVFNLSRLTRTAFAGQPPGQRATNFTLFANRVPLVCDDGSVLLFNIEDTTQPPTVCPAALAGVLDFTEEGMWVGSLDGAVRLYDVDGREEKVLLTALAALPTKGLRAELMDEHLLAPPDAVGDARDSLTLPRRLLSLVTFERALLVYLTQSGPRLARALASQPASFAHLISAHGAVTELQKDLVQSLTAALPSPDLETLYKTKVLDQTALFAAYANAVAEFANYVLNMGPPPDPSRPPATVTMAEAAGSPSVSHFLRELALPLVEIASRGSLLPTSLAVKFEVFLTAEDSEQPDLPVQSLFHGARRASEASAPASAPVLPLGGPPPPPPNPAAHNGSPRSANALVTAQRHGITVQALQTAESDFLSALSVATRRYRDALSPRGWLADKDVLLLFAPAEAVRNIHLLILSTFSMAAKAEMSLATALPLLLDHLPRYEDYVASVGPARRLYTFASSHAKFAELFRSWAQEQAAQIGQTLQELLFETPLTRLALYAEHVETALLSASASAQPALLKLSIVLKRAPLWLQAKLDEASAADDYQLLQKVLSGAPSGFLVGRRLLRRGLLTVQGKSRVVLLFGDTVVVCRQLKDWNLVVETLVDLTQPGLAPALLPGNRALEMHAQLQEAPAPKTILLFVGRTDEETVAWSVAITTALERLQRSVFGVPLSQLSDAQGEVPRFVTQILALLGRHVFVQNVFLQPAGAAQVKKVKALLNKALPDSLGAETWDPHLLAALVLEFLADLPEPVFDLQRVGAADLSAPARAAVLLYESAPTPAKRLADAVLAVVLRLLQHHETNRLSAHVLALALGPAMIRTAAVTDFASVSDVSRSAAVFEALIEWKRTGASASDMLSRISSPAALASPVAKKALPVPPGRRPTLHDASRPINLPVAAIDAPSTPPSSPSPVSPLPAHAAAAAPPDALLSPQTKKPLPAPPPRRATLVGAPVREPSAGLPMADLGAAPPPPPQQPATP